MIRKSKGNRQFTMFGIMAVILGCGDAFHLVPRATALCTTGLENFTVQLGSGKWITSITMTIFYVVLYHIWRERYQIKGCKAATAAIYILAGLRIHIFLSVRFLSYRPNEYILYLSADPVRNQDTVPASPDLFYIPGTHNPTHR